MMVRTATQNSESYADGGAVIQKIPAQSPHALTQDAPLDGDSHVLGPEFHRVEIIEGSRPELTGETTDLLRTRLRAAAGILGLAFTAFFIYRLFRGDPLTTTPTARRSTFTSSFAWCCSRRSACCAGDVEIPLGVLRGYEMADLSGCRLRSSW